MDDLPKICQGNTNPTGELCQSWCQLVDHSNANQNAQPTSLRYHVSLAKGGKGLRYVHVYMQKQIYIYTYITYIYIIVETKYIYICIHIYIYLYIHPNCLWSLGVFCLCVISGSKIHQNTAPWMYMDLAKEFPDIPWTGWWFQPLWKITVKLDHFPK